MVSWGGTRELVGRSRSWDFPAIDDQTARGDQQIEPSRLPSRMRFVVAGIIGLVVVGLAVVAVGVIAQQRSTTQELPALEVPLETQLANANPTLLIVHVSGAVNRPGLVEVADSARVFDALELAGGATPLADINRINLARPVMDGEHIIVPEIGAEGELASSGDSEGPISLSRSSSERLQELPGVGPAIAARIIAWRDEHGRFSSVDDALAIPGIGPATLEGFRDQVVP